MKCFYDFFSFNICYVHSCFAIDIFIGKIWQMKIFCFLVQCVQHTMLFAFISSKYPSGRAFFPSFLHLAHNTQNNISVYILKFYVNFTQSVVFYFDDLIKIRFQNTPRCVFLAMQNRKVFSYGFRFLIPSTQIYSVNHEKKTHSMKEK